MPWSLPSVGNSCAGSSSESGHPHKGGPSIMRNIGPATLRKPKPSRHALTESKARRRFIIKNCFFVRSVLCKGSTDFVFLSLSQGAILTTMLATRNFSGTRVKHSALEPLLSSLVSSLEFNFQFFNHETNTVVQGRQTCATDSLPACGRRLAEALGP